MNFCEAQFNKIAQKDSTGIALKAKTFMWWYPYLVALDQRYTMFSSIHRMYTDYEFYGVGENNEKYVYPIEGQSERTFLEKNFFDHKKGKLHLILWNNPFGREAYSQYLYRAYKHQAPFEIKKLAIGWYWQEILPFELAKKTGNGLSSVKNHYTTEYYDIKN